MPGCCILALLLAVGPRVVLFGAWLFSGWYAAFDSGLLAVLGWLLAPWTSLAWMYAYFGNDGDLSGFHALVMVIGVLLDVSAVGGGHLGRSRRED